MSTASDIVAGLGGITNIGDTQGLRSFGQAKGELPLRIGEGPTAGVLNADDRSTFDRFIVLSRNDYPSHGYLLLCPGKSYGENQEQQA